MTAVPLNAIAVHYFLYVRFIVGSLFLNQLGNE